MAIQTEPTRIAIPFADSGTKNAIPDTQPTPSASQAASWEDGFPPQCSLPLSAGGIPPARADFNGIFNAITQSERFTEEGGVWTWDATVDYAANRVVLGSDAKLYWSVAQSGPNVGGAQDPTTDNGTYWQAMPMDDADVVHKTGAETITGKKSFADIVEIYGNTPDGFCVKINEIDLDTTPTSNNAYLFTSVKDADNDAVTGMYFYTTPSISELDIYCKRLGMGSGLNSNAGMVLRDQISVDPSLIPYGNATVTLGGSGRRWKQLYAATTTINTSDARLKTEPEQVPDEVLDAWEDVDFVQFQMLDSVDKKGADKARLHNGLIAQRIDEAFKAHGLDAARYGLFCWDEWEAEPERVDEKGEVVQPALPAGECFSLRYEEALCMEAACQRRRADRAEARLAALEERLAAIEAKLG